jgi:hypothetical protein
MGILRLERIDSFEDALVSADSILNGMDTIILTAALFDTQDNLEIDFQKKGKC